MHFNIMQIMLDYFCSCQKEVLECLELNRTEVGKHNVHNVKMHVSQQLESCPS